MLSEKSKHIAMKEKDLKDMSRKELITLIVKLNKKSKPRTVKTVRLIPTPRKSVKQMVQEYEDSIIPPPSQFRDDYKPVHYQEPRKQY